MPFESPVKYVSVNNTAAYSALIRAHYEGSVYVIGRVAAGSTQKAEPIQVDVGKTFRVSLDVDNGNEVLSPQVLVYAPTTNMVALYTSGGSPRDPSLTFNGIMG